LISRDDDGGQVLSDHASLLDGHLDPLVMPGARVRLVPVRPRAVVGNHIHNSCSDFIIVGRVKLHFTSRVVDLEKDTARITIGAVGSVGDDTSVLARVIGDPGVPVGVGVVDEGYLQVSIQGHRHFLHSVKRRTFKTVCCANSGPGPFWAVKFIFASSVPVRH